MKIKLIFGCLAVIIISIIYFRVRPPKNPGDLTSQQVNAGASQITKETKKNPLGERAPAQSQTQASAPALVRSQGSAGSSGSPNGHEEVLMFLEKFYKTHLSLNVDENGRAFRLIGEIHLENQSMENFLRTIAPALDIDHPEQLPKATSQIVPFRTVLNYLQYYDGLMVYDGQVRVQLDSQGHVSAVTSSFVPNIKDVNMGGKFSAADALAIAVKDAIANYDSYQKRPPQTATNQMIYRFKKTGVATLCWDITVNQPWVGYPHASGHYFVSTLDGSFERVETSLE